MSNPALNEKFLTKIRGLDDTSRMTINGTMNRAGFLILLTILGAMLGWNMNSGLMMIASLITALVTSLVIIFKPTMAPTLSPVYAIAEGLMLGSISAMYALTYPGIVTNALILTLSVTVLMLALYRFKIVVVTDRLRSIIIGATLAIAVTYLVNMIMSFFGTSIPMIHQSGTWGIVFSVVVVGVAAMNLLLDFDMIERAQAQGAPKFMEWYSAFAVLVTLVWLYLEILRLLSKINRK